MLCSSHVDPDQFPCPRISWTGPSHPLLPVFLSPAGLHPLMDYSPCSSVSSFTIFSASKYCQSFHACQALVLPPEHSRNSDLQIVEVSELSDGIEAMGSGPGTAHLATHFQNTATPYVLAGLMLSPVFSASFYINTVASRCFL